MVYKNEIVKRKFFGYLRESKGFSEKTIGCYEGAILRWQDFSNNADFAVFNKTRAGQFKEWLRARKKVKLPESIGLSYCYDTLRFLKTFFGWLSKQAGYKRKIDPMAIEYLNLPKADARIATQPRKKEIPSLEEVKAVIESIKGKSEAEIRDKAMISLMFLTGARISAIKTLRMKCLDREKLIIYQDPTFGVETKFSKRIVTPLVSPSYEDPLKYFLEWFDYLEKQKKFEPNDPLFPATKIENGKENLSYYNTGEVKPIFWKSSSSPRRIFEKRFEQAGVRPYHPHTLRHLFIERMTKLPLTEEQKKAISQSLGHENVGTTFGSYGYGSIDEERQIDIIRNIDFTGKKNEDTDLLKKIKELIQSKQP
ncbi:MAG: site-specific integrase [Bacteroidota bacterium]